jgi:hypothetical protein
MGKYRRKHHAANEPPEPELDMMQRKAPYIPGLDACVAATRFTLHDSDEPYWYHPSFGGGMRLNHRRAAEWYARKFFAQHGRLPEGTHYVSVLAKPCGQQGAGIENVFYGRNLIAVDVTYPGARPSALPPDPR